ncbi:hypothetical protein [Deinococcus proteolyticus]|uniref:hypothetical protein n=1 Tax=Deinococcus proteolyticus TaxID=55148 RepID=UPI0002E2A3D1|nr:hypothetical protein [Deinococcus proteolyticus]
MPRNKVWALWDDFYAEAWQKRQQAARAARPWKWAAAAGAAALMLGLARRSR